MAVIRETGLATTARFTAGRLGASVSTHQTSSGTILSIVLDTNTASAKRGEKNNLTKLYVYEYNPTTLANTLRATISAPATGMVVVEGAIHPNNDLSIAVRSTNARDISYCKMTYGTWGVSAWELPLAAASGTIGFMSLAVSAGTGIVGLAYSYLSSSSLSAKVQLRASGSASWTAATTMGTPYSSGTRQTAMEGIALAFTRGGDTDSTTVNICVALGSGTTVTDYGTRLYTARVTTSTRAISSITYRKTVGNATISNSSANSRSIAFLSKDFVDGYDSYDFDLLVGQISGGRVRCYVDSIAWWGTLWAGSGVPQTYLAPANHTASSDVVTFSAGYGTVGEYAGASFGFHYTRMISSGSYHGLVMFHRGDGSSWRDDLYWSDRRPQHYFRASQDLRHIRDETIRHNSLEYYWVQGPGGASDSFLSAEITQAPPPNKPDGSTVITSIAPADGSEEVGSTPMLWLYYTVTDSTRLGHIKGEWQLSQDPTFATGVVNVVQPNSSYTALTSPVGSATGMYLSIKAANRLSGGAWYMRARVVTDMAGPGAWSASVVFTVGHPPRLTPSRPSDGAMVPFGTGNVLLSWTFADRFTEDYQTAYQIQIQNSDASWSVDTGKVVSGTLSGTVTVPSAQKARPLQWRVRGWDSLDSVGVYSDYSEVTVADPPTITWDYDLPPGQMQIDVPTGTPSITATISSPQNLPRTKFEFEITKGNESIYLWANTSSVSSPSVITLSVPPNLLENDSQYTFIARAETGSGLSVVKTSPILTGWPKPPAPLMPTAVLNDVEVHGGYMEAMWRVDNAESDFFKWVVERRSGQFIVETSSVVQWSDWSVVYESFENTGAEWYPGEQWVSFKDYFAPSGHMVEYRIRQVSVTNGHFRHGDGSVTNDALVSLDGYCLLAASEDRGSVEIFKLHNVTGDQFTDEQEEFETIVIGRGRVFQKGDYLGVKGTLDAQLRNTGGTTAREKRLGLLEVQRHNRDLWLRNPFGDILRVNVSSMSVTRIAGVGISEFCDVQIPYAEVSE